ncbi:hypothetical protein [Cyclobacterium plantarum]|uniref:Uncharacterized protein n=1 Tax=Cyclobacterium plantarum TaxID=2716263 RepID=A0ABX0HG92_9BACT|nr:hypothetical protein [Cyclobacterium plantarum]NHE59359.1 hypothetical protein [Cyclobacterium plantarum]
MDYRAVKSQFRQTGKITLEDSRGQVFEWLSPGRYPTGASGIFLIHELYQLQALVGSFSEVALDIVEFSPDKVIFHSPPANGPKDGMNSTGLIKFALIKSPFWHRLLFELRETVVLQWVENTEEAPHSGEQPFPLQAKGSKAMELHADGKVKIINA